MPKLRGSNPVQLLGGRYMLEEVLVPKNLDFCCCRQLNTGRARVTLMGAATAPIYTPLTTLGSHSRPMPQHTCYAGKVLGGGHSQGPSGCGLGEGSG